MNELEFSRISEKHEESVDTVSFIYPQRILTEEQKKAEHLCETFERITANRLSYSIQLLKQFILFPSDEQSISIDYRYMRHEIQSAVDKLQISYGFKKKLVLGKAFQDIFVFSKKQEAYYNEENLLFLLERVEKVQKMYRQRTSIFSFFTNLKETWQSSQKIIKKSRPLTPIDGMKHSEESVKLSYSSQNKRQKSYQSFSNESSLYSEQNNHKHSKRNEKARSKGHSEAHTPVSRRESREDFNYTKKKKMIRSSITVKNEQQPQEIFIVRESATSRKRPVKFLRIPITSHDIKIVQYEKQRKQKEKNEYYYENSQKYEEFLRSTREKRSYKRYDRRSKIQGYGETHECQGCKYCKMVAEMTEFRVNRTYDFYDC